jgi:hypothetical protein
MRAQAEQAVPSGQGSRRGDSDLAIVERAMASHPVCFHHHHRVIDATTLSIEIETKPPRARRWLERAARTIAVGLDRGSALARYRSRNAT